MKLSKLKWLKIAGIIFIVSAILALGVLGIIFALNKEKVYLNAFAGEIENKIDTQKAAFDSLETKNATLYEYVSASFELRELENKNLNENIGYVKNYFSTIGFNSDERKEIDSMVKSLTGYRASLDSIYKNLKEISDKASLTSEDVNNFKNIYKESYLVNLDLVINTKIDLFNFLNESLAKHKIVETNYIKNIQTLSLNTIKIVQTINIPHIKTYDKTEASFEYSKTMLTKLNETLVKINNNTKDYSNPNLSKLISDLNVETTTLIEQTNEFLNSYNNLSKLEIETLSKTGTGFDYTISAQTDNLKVVVNFLKENGTLFNSIKDDGKIMLGINL